MHARRLVELAASLSVHSEGVLAATDRLPEDALTEYWIASRCRLDKWGRELRRLGDSRSAGEARGLGGLAEEIVLSEVLARVVAAITAAHDERHGGGEAGPVGRNAFEGHAESRRRARVLTRAWWPADGRSGRRFRRLSERCGRWSDALLAWVDGERSVVRFAVDPRRLSAFRDDRRRHTRAGRAATLALITAALRLSLCGATGRSPCEDLNRRVGGAALALLGPNAFDGFGLPRSPWMIRLERSTQETTAMLDELLANASRDDFTTPRFSARRSL